MALRQQLRNTIWDAVEEAEWFATEDPLKLRASRLSMAWMERFAAKISEAGNSMLAFQG
jgi:hypothetical protein